MRRRKTRKFAFGGLYPNNPLLGILIKNHYLKHISAKKYSLRLVHDGLFEAQLCTLHGERKKIFEKYDFLGSRSRVAYLGILVKFTLFDKSQLEMII